MKNTRNEIYTGKYVRFLLTLQQMVLEQVEKCIQKKKPQQNPPKLLSYISKKLKSIIDLSVKSETVKPLEKYIEDICDLWLVKKILDITPKEWSNKAKINKLDF